MNRLSLCFTGDTILTRSLQGVSAPGWSRLVEMLRGADAAFTNLESCCHDYQFPPAAHTQGPRLRTPPRLLHELATFGIRFVSLANNHMGDWGEGGIGETVAAVSAAGLIGAGAGASLSAAREPRTLSIAGHRIALVACTATFPPHSRAGDSHGGHPPRAGINPLRHKRIHRVTPQQMAYLADLRLSLDIPTEWRPPGATEDLRLWGQHFAIGHSVGVSSSPHPSDLRSLHESIGRARQMADLVVVSIHHHERDVSDPTQPPAFVREAARTSIDAGADVIVGHGPHRLQGIEIYKGKMICYSLGNFIFQPELLERLAWDDSEVLGLAREDSVSAAAARVAGHLRRQGRISSGESAALVLTWHDKRLVSAEIHPLTLHTDRNDEMRGIPMIADTTVGETILRDVASLSQALKTSIGIRNGHGDVCLDSTTYVQAR